MITSQKQELTVISDKSFEDLSKEPLGSYQKQENENSLITNLERRAADYL